MDQVDTLHIDRYWYNVFAVPSWPTLVTLMVKVTDLEIYKSIFLKHVDGSS